MRILQIAVAAVLVSFAGLGQAAVVPVKVFEADTAVVFNAYSFTNWSTPYTIAKAGEYSFDVVLKSTDGNLATLSDELFINYQPLKLTQLSGYFDTYVGSFKFTAKDNDLLQYRLGFSVPYNVIGKVNISLNQVAPVPEPETYALMGLGLVGLLAARRRKLAA